MKRMIVGLLAVCLLGSLTVLAKEKATTEKAVKKEVVLQEITATGKLAKLGACFTVTEADGTLVKFMAPKAIKGEEAPAVTLEALDKLVGKDVKVVGKVVGKGATKTGKAGKKTSVIKTVTSVEEAVASEAEAPAVEAPEAEAPAVTVE